MIDRRYHPEHMWASSDRSEFIVGVTELAQEQLCDILYVRLPDVGTAIQAGTAVGTAEAA
jgi:glycine cleavage system H protein